MMISVILCTYNRAESLRDTLRILAAQRLPHGVPCELLVVDNNSSDRTRHVVEETQAAFPWPLRYLFESRQGKTYAMNHGVRESRGDVIVLTDDDTLPEPD